MWNVELDLLVQGAREGIRLGGAPGKGERTPCLKSAGNIKLFVFLN